MFNPFILEPYRSKDLFCDRVEEMKTIINYLENGRNITIISPRRLGKTGLIYRVFDEIREKKKKIDTFYIDISSTQCIDDFIRLLSENVVQVLQKQSKVLNFLNKMAGVRPVLMYDPASGQPQISITYRNESEKAITLKSILSFLESHKRKVVLAIDEFQQVREYPGVDMEALLRTYIHPLKNLNFIFCGSKKHIMVDMFSNAKKPFYESTTFLSLQKLNEKTYSDFIVNKFKDGGKTIDKQLVSNIIEWTRCHTFYTQNLCNEIFLRSSSKVSEEDYKSSIEHILLSNKDRFLELQRLITPSQWNLLKAIAKESYVEHPTSFDFLKKYNLSSGAAVLKNLNTLIDKELILVENTDKGVKYYIYNVFLSRYLEQE